MLRAFLFALVVPLALVACLETEEVIDVAGDGSVQVRVTAKGDAADLANGTPLPTGGPWLPVDEPTRAFLAGAELADETPVAVQARFERVEDLPRHFGRAHDPYRDAGLERTSTFTTEHRSGRTLHRFVRVFGARRHRDWDFDARLQAVVPKDLRDELDASLESGEAMPAARLDVLIAGARQALREAARTQARAAVGAIFTESDAAFSLASRARVLDTVDAAVARAVPEGLLRRLYDELLLAKEDPERELPGELDLDLRVREVLRSSLAPALEREGLAAPLRHGVLERLEWCFSSADQSADLADESLVLRVGLPGTIVEGNYDRLEDGRAVWTRSGQDVFDADIELWALSVSE